MHGSHCSPAFVQARNRWNSEFNKDWGSWKEFTWETSQAWHTSFGRGSAWLSIGPEHETQGKAVKSHSHPTPPKKWLSWNSLLIHFVNNLLQLALHTKAKWLLYDSLELHDSEQDWSSAPPRERGQGGQPTLRGANRWAKQAARPAGSLSLSHHVYTKEQWKERVKQRGSLPHWGAFKMFPMTDWKTRLPK